MAATLNKYTQTTQFGLTNGPTYSGASVVSAVSVPRLYSELILHSGSPQTIDVSGFNYANWLAMGFMAQLDPVQTGTPGATPSITVNLVAGLSGGSGPYTITLSMGQSVSWVVIPATLVHNVTSITVTPDSAADVDLYGILVVSS